MTEDIVLGGIEGGATHSKVVLYNSKGEKLVQCSGPGTNHWIYGMDECQNRIHKMVEEAKREAGIPLSKPLAALGMSLSGCEQEETNLQLQQGLLDKFPTLSEKYVVCSDTVGSIAAAHQYGGVVLIAGTGSNGLLLNPDGSVSRCGGWGHLMGDEGGAWWISHKAMKVFFDEQDNLADPPYSTDYVWEAIQQHFNVKTRFDILEHCYSNFDKPTFAGLCKVLAEGAKQGDPLCLWLFAEAGGALAKYILALVPNAHPTLKNAPGGLPVVCVGSVWLSWEYLRPGFIKTLGNLETPLSLLRLTTSMAVGATYLAAQAINYDMPRDYKSNYQVFFYYNPDKMKCQCQINEPKWLHVCTDGSGTPREGNAGEGIYSREFQISCPAGKNGSNFEREICLILQLLQRINENKEKKFVILSDSKAAIQAIVNHEEIKTDIKTLT